MLRLRHIGPNATEVTIGALTVLFSYSSPVAAQVEGEGWYRTPPGTFSATTSKHINAWIPQSASPTEMYGADFENWLDVMTTLFEPVGGR